MNAQLDLVPEVEATKGPDDNQRYTTRQMFDWVLKKLSVDAFDLDVAACVESHWADQFFTREIDGLRQQWRASRIFLNPPWDDLEVWVKKSWLETVALASGVYGDRLTTGVLGFICPENRREQEFWQKHIEPFRDGRDIRRSLRRAPRFPRLFTDTMPGRQAFGHPGNPHAIGVKPQMQHGVVLVSWRW